MYYHRFLNVYYRFVQKIERPVIKREGLVVSRKVQKMLPFSSKPKFQRKKMVTKSQKTLKPIRKTVMRNKEEHEVLFVSFEYVIR